MTEEFKGEDSAVEVDDGEFCSRVGDHFEDYIGVLCLFEGLLFGVVKGFAVRAKILVLGGIPVGTSWIAELVAAVSGVGRISAAVQRLGFLGSLNDQRSILSLEVGKILPITITIPAPTRHT